MTLIEMLYEVGKSVILKTEMTPQEVDKALKQALSSRIPARIRIVNPKYAGDCDHFIHVHKLLFWNIGTESTLAVVDHVPANAPPPPSPEQPKSNLII